MIFNWILVVIILGFSASFTLYLGRKGGCLSQTVVALILQVTLSTFYLLVWGLNADALTYHNATILFVETWSNGLDPIYTLPVGKRSTVVIAGFFYWLVGSYPIVVLLFTATITAWLPSLVSTATKLFGFYNASKRGAWLGALAPPLILWAPWLTRESMAFVLLGLSTVVFGLIYRYRISTAIIILWIVTALGMSVVRPQLLIGLAAGSLVSVLIRKNPTISSSSSRPDFRLAAERLLMASLCFVAVWWVFTATDAGERAQPEVREQIMTELSEANSTFSVTYPEIPNPAPNDSKLREPPPEIGGEINQVAQYLQRGVNSLVGPFPWNWKSLSWVIPGLDGIFMLMVWVLIAYGAIFYRKTRKLVLILIFACLPLIAGEAYFHANYGITMRVRAHYLVILLPAIAAISSSLWPSFSKLPRLARDSLTFRPN